MFNDNSEMHGVQSCLKHFHDAVSRRVFVNALVTRVEDIYRIGRGTFQADLNFLIEQFNHHCPHILHRSDLTFIQEACDIGRAGGLETR